jgi:pyrroloquinoline quinone (PQQ) biosynthesis protein C
VIITGISATREANKRRNLADRLTELLNLYQMLPFAEHPMWKGVRAGEFEYKQVIRAETQHYLRTRFGQDLRKRALDMAKATSPAIFELLLKTYLEECTRDQTGPSHLELVERLVVAGGCSVGGLSAADMTPGNAAAVALYRDITERGAGCHMLAAGVVEYYYSQLSPKIFEAYTNIYGMSQDQAETYSIHGEMDNSHAQRAFQVLDEIVDAHGWREVYRSVRDAFVATSLHYDGMRQAATGKIQYWDGSRK